MQDADPENLAGNNQSNQGNASDQEIDDNPGPNQAFAVLPVPHHQEPHLMSNLKGGLQPLTIQ